MYPNPSSGYITLTGDAEVDLYDLSVAIFSIDGRQLPLNEKQVSINNDKLMIDLEGMETGYYFVRLSSSDGKQLTKRLTLLK